MPMCAAPEPMRTEVVLQTAEGGGGPFCTPPSSLWEARCKTRPSVGTVGWKPEGRVLNRGKGVSRGLR